VKDEDRVPIVRKAEVDVSRVSYKLSFRCLRESCYMYGTPKAGFGPTY